MMFFQESLQEVNRNTTLRFRCCQAYIHFILASILKVSTFNTLWALDTPFQGSFKVSTNFTVVLHCM